MNVGLLALILATTLAACGTSHDHTEPKKAELPRAEFTALQPQFFGKTGPGADAAYEEQMLAVAEKARAATADATGPDCADCDDAAKMMAYAGHLLSTDTAASARYGLHLADDDQVADARFAKAIGLIERATQLSERGFYKSILRAARLERELRRTGKIPENELDAMLAAAVTSPNDRQISILVLHDEPLDAPETEKLFHTMDLIDAQNAGAAPKPACEVINSRIILASVVAIADTYMRRGEQTGSQADLQRAYGTLKFAQSCDNDVLKTWVPRDTLAEREQRLGQLLSGAKADPAFYQSASYDRVYQCTSCHGVRQ